MKSRSAAPLTAAVTAIVVAFALGSPTLSAAAATTTKKSTKTTKKATTTTKKKAVAAATTTKAAAATATTAVAGADTTPAVVAAMEAFLGTLSPAEKAKVMFSDFAKQSDWSNLPDQLYKRDGLHMADMTATRTTVERRRVALTSMPITRTISAR